MTLRDRAKRILKIIEEGDDDQDITLLIIETEMASAFSDFILSTTKQTIKEGDPYAANHSIS